MGDDLMQTVSVMTRDDGDDEQNENFRLTLSAAMNATIEDGIAVGTILDNDGPPSLSVAPGEGMEGEGNTVDFEVTLTLASTMTRTEAVTVMFATSSGTATSGLDFTEKSEILTFAADAEGDALTQTVSVAILDDDISEGPETFTVTLSSVSPNAESRDWYRDRDRHN